MGALRGARLSPQSYERLWAVLGAVLLFSSWAVHGVRARALLSRLQTSTGSHVYAYETGSEASLPGGENE